MYWNRKQTLSRTVSFNLKIQVNLTSLIDWLINNPTTPTSLIDEELRSVHTQTHTYTQTHTQAWICLLLTCRQHFTYGEVCWSMTLYSPRWPLPLSISHMSPSSSSSSISSSSLSSSHRVAKSFLLSDVFVGASVVIHCVARIFYIQCLFSSPSLPPPPPRLFFTFCETRQQYFSPPPPPPHPSPFLHLIVWFGIEQCSITYKYLVLFPAFTCPVYHGMTLNEKHCWQIPAALFNYTKQK